MDVSNLARVFRENVIRLLTEKQISRNELSRRTGMHQQSVVQLLNNSTEIRTDTIERIAVALDVTVDELLNEMSAV